MGEYAEMAIEYERTIGGDLEAPDFRVWKCRDGRSIRVRDMATSHLKSTIAMLERERCPAFEGWLYEMKQELATREGA